MEYVEEDPGSLPLDMDTLDGNRTFLPTRVSPYIPDAPVKAPTKLEGFAAAFRAASPITAAYRQINLNPLSEETPDGWTPANWDKFVGIDPKYFPRLLEAKNETEQDRIREIVLLQQRDDEIMMNSGWFMNLTGSFLGGALSPASLIPIASIASNAKLGLGAIKSMTAAMPGVTAGAIAYEAGQHALREGSNLHDSVLNTFADITMGTLMIGGGYGLSHAFRAGRLWEARRIPELSAKGIEVKPIVADDGTILDYHVFSPDRSASAAEVDAAKHYVNSMVDKSGMFAIPIIGGWIGKGAALGNPNFRMQTSPYKVMNEISSLIGDNAFITKGVKEGIAKPETFESKMYGLAGENKRFFDVMKGLFYSRNGIDASNQYEGALKAMVARNTRDGFVSEEAFGKEIANVFITGEPSPHAAVNEAVTLVRMAKDEPYAAFRKAYNLSEKVFPQATMEEHLTRDYNRNFMQSNSESWGSMWVKWLRDSDGIIESYQSPIRDAETRIREMERSFETDLQTLSSTQVADATRAIEAAKRDLTQMRNDLQNELRNNPELRIHVDDFAALSATEAEELTRLMQPIRDAQKQAETIQSLVSDIRKKVARAKQAKLKAKTKETAEKHAAIEDELRKQLDAHERTLHDAKNKINAAEEDLQQMAHEGKINPMLYNRAPDSGRFVFKDPSNRLKLREVYRDDQARLDAAMNWRDTILGQTTEDTMQQTLYTLMGGTMQSPNPTKKRSLMIPDSILMEYGFLSTDVARNIINYRTMLGRMTFMKNTFRDVTLEGGIEPFIEQLTKEHRVRDRAVNAIKDPKKRAKAARKLNKEFKKAKEDLQFSYNRMMGRNMMTAKQRAFSNITRSIAAATRLGAVPLTMVTEPFAIALKHGFWPTIRDGFIPTLLNMEGRIKKHGAGSPERLGAADLNIALEHVTMGAADRNWNGVAMQGQDYGVIESFTQTLAQHSGNWNFTNYIDNWLQRVTANVVDSKIMRYMQKHQKGELSKKQKQELLMMGIDPDKFAKRFIDGWKSAGSDSNGIGGYHSNFVKWEDIEAANLMSRAIRNTVRDTIVRRGLIDVPFLADNPLAQMYFTFKGWSFAAFGRYTIPLLQRPDAQMLTATMAMLTAGAFVTPLRRIFRGEEAFTDDDSMFWDAMVDGGMFSLLAGMIEDVNVLTQGRLLKGFQNDKYRNLGIMGIMGGPTGQIGDDMGRIITMAASNNWNESDMKKMSRLIPFTQSWYLRQLSNKMVESLQLPATMADAERARN